LFVKTHLDPSIVTKGAGILASGLGTYFPGMVAHLAGLHSDGIGLRGVETAGEAGDARPAVSLDAELVIHTPVAGDRPVAERQPHLKNGTTLFEAHYFLRHPEDVEQGGELMLYSVPGGVHPEFGERRQTDCPDLVIERVFPYRANTLFLFLNTQKTITQLAPRGPTRYPMRYFALVVEVAEELVQVPGSGWS
jgi:hypothetical protein